MSKAKFTKGPWVIGLRHQNMIPIHHEDMSPGAISSPLAKIVARMTWIDEACANSHLIAASPTMYEALENLLGAFDTPISRRRLEKDEFALEALKVARAALSLARGETK